MDKVAWLRSNYGIYSVRTGYHYWYNLKLDNVNIPKSLGWKNVSNMKIPHKMKVFIWRFCRNVVPIRMRLNSKGVRILITSPMCLIDIEHMSHLFFDRGMLGTY